MGLPYNYYRGLTTAFPKELGMRLEPVAIDELMMEHKGGNYGAGSWYFCEGLTSIVWSSIRWLQWCVD